jgi:hypothetical protein
MASGRDHSLTWCATAKGASRPLCDSHCFGFDNGCRGKCACSLVVRQMILPVGEDETLCPLRLTIDVFTLLASHTVCGDEILHLPSRMMGLGLPVSSDSNRYVYSSTDDACVRPYCSHRLWSEVCSTHRWYTQDLPHLQY